MLILRDSIAMARIRAKSERGDTFGIKGPETGGKLTVPEAESLREKDKQMAEKRSDRGSSVRF